MRPPVEPERPRGAVASRRDEVVPVLADEPDAGERPEDRGELGFDLVGGRADSQGEQDRGAQMPLVDPLAEQVQAGAEGMAVDADDRRHVLSIQRR
jgi:hypothetical protein